MGDEAGPAIVARHVSRGCAFGDFDNDGDLDVLIMNRNEPPSLLRNDAPSGNHWIKVRLEGTKSNRSAIGSRVLVRYGGKVQAQMRAQPVQLSFLERSATALRLGSGLHGRRRGLLADWQNGILPAPGRGSVGHDSRRAGNRQRTAVPLGRAPSWFNKRLPSFVFTREAGNATKT